MSGFVGADVDQLVALAATFDRRSTAFTQIASASSTSLMVAEWTGADVDRVRSEWNRQARPAILKVAEELRTLAVDLRKQAEQQRETSGGGSPAVFTWPSPWPAFPDFRLPWPIKPDDLTRRFPDFIDRIRGIVEAGGSAFDGIDLMSALADGTKLKDVVSGLPDLKIGTVFSLVGMGFSANDLGIALGEGDEAGTVSSSLDLVIGGVGIFVPGAGIAYDLGQWIGETGYQGVQQVHDTETGAINSALEDMYGRGTRLEDLTLEQSTALSQRYEGPLGFCASISDGMRGVDRDFRRWIGLDW